MQRLSNERLQHILAVNPNTDSGKMAAELLSFRAKAKEMRGAFNLLADLYDCECSMEIIYATIAVNIKKIRDWGKAEESEDGNG
jgi:hypothetical protein